MNATARTTRSRCLYRQMFGSCSGEGTAWKTVGPLGLKCKCNSPLPKCTELGMARKSLRTYAAVSFPDETFATIASYSYLVEPVTKRIYKPSRVGKTCKLKVESSIIGTHSMICPFLDTTSTDRLVASSRLPWTMVPLSALNVPGMQNRHRKKRVT